MYLEETAGGSILAGVVIVVLLLWSLWIAGWLRRIELRAQAEPVAQRLGLHFHSEGVLGRVRASGTLEGVPVEVAWSHRVRVRVRGGAWSPVEPDAVEHAVRTAVTRGA